MSDMKERDRLKPQAAAASAPADQFDRDLNPNTMAGQNIGSAGKHPEKHGRTAKGVKDVHAVLSDWSDDDLDQIPVGMAPGWSRTPPISICPRRPGGSSQPPGTCMRNVDSA